MRVRSGLCARLLLAAGRGRTGRLWRRPGSHPRVPSAAAARRRGWLTRAWLATRVVIVGVRSRRRDDRLYRHGQRHVLSILHHNVVKGNADLRFFLLLTARLNFSDVSDHPRILGYNKLAVPGLQILRDPGVDFVAGLRFLGIDALG